MVTAPNGLAGSPRSGEPGKAPAVQRCPTCQQHFSGEARFCPFDGDVLASAPEYRASADPLLGTVIDGRYEVECVLGEGGMGTVYRVRHRSLDKRFALKIMRVEMAAEGENAARFLQEARAAAAIRHPNIVEITDFGEIAGRVPFFVMELLDGIALSKLLRSGGPPPFARAVQIVKQIAAALAAAHAAGVIHRDLKPDNIQITASDRVKVLDFGVAKMAGSGRLTRTGMVFGTPHYMSPEQASGAPIDHRADVYALGVIMYEMFAGRVPFEADSYMGVLTKHMFMAPEPPSQVNERVREIGALEDVVMQCLEKRPEARFASMDALILEIESIVRFAGDKVEILRARSPHRAPAMNLADELEPPAREEVVGLYRPAGVPRPASAGVWLGAVAVAILIAGVSVRWLRPQAPPDVPQALVGGGLTPPTSPVTSPSVMALSVPPASSAVLGAASATGVAPTGTLEGASGSVRADPAFRPRTRQEHPSRAPGHADAPRGRAAAASGSSTPALGTGDIVNPWAK